MVARRTFITPTAIRQGSFVLTLPSSPHLFQSLLCVLLLHSPSPADLVQELYLKELKGYKAPPLKANDSEGHVQKWSAPATPKSPEEADIANELKSYEASTAEVEGQAEGGAVEKVDDWFEEEPEEEEAHH